MLIIDPVAVLCHLLIFFLFFRSSDDLVFLFVCLFFNEFVLVNSSILSQDHFPYLCL